MNRLLLAMFLTGCVPTPTDRVDRFAGTLPPCSVDVSTSIGDGRDAGELWEPGPFFAWNTHPDELCNDNPTVPLSASRTVTAVTGDTARLEFRDRQLYITYPTMSDPTVTGAGGIAPGPHPVVVFAHANHDGVCQIFESYYSLHDHWASHGWVVASVDGTAFNCDRGDSTNINLRAQSMQTAIARLEELNADPSSRFFAQLDLSTIVLAGHSRGGGASFIAARGRNDIDAIMTIQGIDPFAFGFPGALTDLPVLGLTAGNDVDLNYPRVEPVEDRLTGPYTWVNINGGIHAYTADIVPLEFDDRPGITRNLQHRLTNLFTTAFLGNVRGAPHADVLYSLRGVEDAHRISGSGVFQRWRRPNGDAVWIDTFDGEDEFTNDLGGATSAEGFSEARETYTYAPFDDAPSTRFRVANSLYLASVGPATYLSELGDAAVDSATAVEFRMKGPDFGVAGAVTVVVAYSDGSSERVRIGAEQRGPLPIGNRFQQVIAELRGEGHITSVALEISGGAVLVDDLRLTYR